MKFRCRHQELEKLEKRYSSGQFECVVIYGRRRVGKTALISKFCEGKPVVFFSALQATAQENLRALSKAIYTSGHPEAESFPVYGTFDEAFREILRLGEERRIVFVIDEYPYLAAADNSISSRLQHLIDHSWAESQIFLILCGSSMSFMQHQLLGYESPLYGRRTAQFHILPLTYRDIAEFNPTLSAEEQAIVYGITGGVPHYINKLNVKESLDRAICDNLLEPSSYLFEEPHNLLEQELREPALYNSVISSVAFGASKLAEISSKLGVSTAVCAKYVSVLADLGILKKETPVTEKFGRKTVYRIEDEFFNFWYRFVPQNMSALFAGNIESIYRCAVKPKLHDYMGLVYEKMCMSYLLRYCEGLPFEIAEIGQWWGTDARLRRELQIDIVASPVKDGAKSGREYIIGSCKFRNARVAIDELEKLTNYAEVFGKGGKYHYYIFSLGGFTDGLLAKQKEGAVRLVTLEDMYA